MWGAHHIPRSARIMAANCVLQSGWRGAAGGFNRQQRLGFMQGAARLPAGSGWAFLRCLKSLELNSHVLFQESLCTCNALQAARAAPAKPPTQRRPGWGPVARQPPL